MKEDLQSFVSITQADEDIARQFLEGAQGNLEMALEQFFENPNKYPTDSKDNHVDSEYCRPPIQPVKTCLLDDSDSIDYVVSSRQFKRGSKRRMDNNRTIFEAFRDFRSERESLDSGTTRKGKASNLAELFRPPLEHLFTGTFEEAKKYAAGQHRYLIVNLQDQTLFDSQLLNRDTWSNNEVQELLETSFVLMQIYEGTNQASDYTRWYQVSRLPHIGVLDGRTGERVLSLDGFTSAQKLVMVLQETLLAYPEDVNYTKLLKERGKQQLVEKEPILVDSPSPDRPPSLFIGDSIKSEPKKETQGKQRPRKDSYDSSSSSKRNKVEKQVEVQNMFDSTEIDEDPSLLDCTLQIRLPDGELLIKKFRSTEKLKAVHAFVSKRVSKTSFSLFTNFPRRVFSEQELLTVTLAEANLVPRAVLIVKET
ncbi:UBX domain-containing protein 7 [Schistocerca gregaria]|uniref:UBX domain-containing protein 7 n=1 Tax=Schistocerca gregaria TaxID=7010 RepID=UPI00211E66DF|nr:UBX domain-containing protein 7 [Schistocerca gregaria]